MTVGLYSLVLALMAVMKFAPQSREARVLNRLLVERPLELLGKMQRHHLIVVAILAGLMLAGGEMVALAGPELAMGFAIDLSIYFDAVLVSYALAVIAGTRGSWRALKLRLLRMRRVVKARRKRSRPTLRKDAPPANDDDRPAYMPLAA